MLCGMPYIVRTLRTITLHNANHRKCPFPRMRSAHPFIKTGAAGSLDITPSQTASNRTRHVCIRGNEVSGVGRPRGVRGRSAGAAVVVRAPGGVVRGAGAAVRAAAADSAQARVRARPAARQRAAAPAEADLRPAAAEALQDRVHQGPDPADPDRAHYPRPATERGEDPRVRPGEEARGPARHRHPHARTHAAFQTGGLLHPVQDPETRRLPSSRPRTTVRTPGFCSLLGIWRPLNTIPKEPMTYLVSISCMCIGQKFCNVRLIRLKYELVL